MEIMRRAAPEGARIYLEHRTVQLSKQAVKAGATKDEIVEAVLVSRL